MENLKLRSTSSTSRRSCSPSWTTSSPCLVFRSRPMRTPWTRRRTTPAAAPAAAAPAAAAVQAASEERLAGRGHGHEPGPTRHDGQQGAPGGVWHLPVRRVGARGAPPSLGSFSHGVTRRPCLLSSRRPICSRAGLLARGDGPCPRAGGDTTSARGGGRWATRLRAGYANKAASGCKALALSSSGFCRHFAS